MLIEESFKLFTTNTLKENKNKKDYDLCIDTYAKTQLIDLCGFDQLTPEVKSKINSFKPQDITSTGLPEYIKEYSLPKDLEVNLPFNECFIKTLVEEQEWGIGEVYVFIREMLPMVYTGAYILVFEGADLGIKIPFRISHNILSEYPIISLDLKVVHATIKEHLNSFFRPIIWSMLNTFAKLSMLNSKSHTIYKVNADKPEYLRKKLSRQAIKVQRPIYIYLPKEVEILRLYPKYSNRSVERLTSWLVRGHWRRLDNPKKRGKDAQGKYVVEGFTWVVPHVCGDKDKITNRTYIAIGK